MTTVFRRPAGVAHQIAGELRAQIQAGELLGGSELPTMEVLGGRFHASVPTVRQALKILESEGRLTVRRGRHGGSVINEPRTVDALRDIATAMRTQPLTFWESALALRCLMAACAGICAGREDRAETVLPALRSIHDSARRQMNSGIDAWRRTEIDFHAELIGQSGNPTLVALAQALESMLRADPDFATERHLVRLDAPPSREAVLDAHADVIARISRGDRDGVIEYGQRHLHTTCGCLALAQAG
jgi:GntR family transcriptional repressor for pyruvate dehydrogenase complex